MTAYKLCNGKPFKMNMCDCVCNPADGSITMAKLARETIEWILERDFADKEPAVIPTFNVEWKNINTGNTSTKLTISAEVGDSFEWKGSYSWKQQTGYSDPYKIESNVFDTLLEPGVESDTITKTVSKDAAFNITFYSLTGAKSTVTSSVSFYQPIYYGILNGTLKKQLSKTHSNTITATTDKDEYFVYKYPSSFPKLEQVIMDGAFNVMQAFNYSEEPFTTDTGLKITLRVYTSANPGAFTNSKLTFK